MNYLPPVRCKSDYDGFYVDNSAIYVSKDDEKDWNCFLTQICRSIRKGIQVFRPGCAGNRLKPEKVSMF